MNFLHLKYVTEVEKTGSITSAAKNLFMGQPNLSKAIRELEKEIGITIFRRNAKGVEATPEGERFLAYAKTIISQMDELESLYKSHDKKIQFHVSAPRATYITVAFTDLISKFDLDSQLDIKFKETSPVGVIKDVTSGESSIGILRCKKIYASYYDSLLKEGNLEGKKLCDFNMQVLMSESHPLAKEEFIHYKQLSGYTEIVHGDFDVPNISFSKINKNAVMDKPRKRIYIYDRGTQYDILKGLPGAYIFVSPIPENILRENRFVTRKFINSDMENSDVLIYPKGHCFNEYEQKFADVLIKTTKEF